MMGCWLFVSRQCRGTLQGESWSWKQLCLQASIRMLWSPPLPLCNWLTNHLHALTCLIGFVLPLCKVNGMGWFVLAFGMYSVTAATMLGLCHLHLGASRKLHSSIVCGSCWIR